MRLVRAGVLRRVRREDGQSLVETALILTLVSVVAMGGLAGVGTSMMDVLQTAVDAAASAL